MVVEFRGEFMKSLVHISAPAQPPSLERAKQFYVMVEREEWKLDTLWDLYETLTIASCVYIYANTCRKVDWLADQMLHSRTTSTLLARGDGAERA